MNGVKLAESGDVQGAMEAFNKAIEIAPKRASGYNNRAQAYRLKGQIDGKISKEMFINWIHNLK